MPYCPYLVEVALDGEEVYRREGLNIGGSLGVEGMGLMFHAFYGGADDSWAPSRDTYLYFRFHTKKMYQT